MCLLGLGVRLKWPFRGHGSRRRPFPMSPRWTRRHAAQLGGSAHADSGAAGGQHRLERGGRMRPVARSAGPGKRVPPWSPQARSRAVHRLITPRGIATYSFSRSSSAREKTAPTQGGCLLSPVARARRGGGRGGPWLPARRVFACQGRSPSDSASTRMAPRVIYKVGPTSKLVGACLILWGAGGRTLSYG